MDGICAGWGVGAVPVPVAVAVAVAGPGPVGAAAAAAAGVAVGDVLLLLLLALVLVLAGGGCDCEVVMAALLLGLLEEGSVGVGGWAACVWLGEAIVDGWLGFLRIARRRARAVYSNLGRDGGNQNYSVVAKCKHDDRLAGARLSEVEVAVKTIERRASPLVPIW